MTFHVEFAIFSAGCIFPLTFNVSAAFKRRDAALSSLVRARARVQWHCTTFLDLPFLSFFHGHLFLANSLLAHSAPNLHRQTPLQANVKTQTLHPKSETTLQANPKA